MNIPITFAEILRLLKQDARHFQILFLSLFLLYGIGMLHWDADMDRYIATFATAMLVQLIGLKLTGSDMSGLKSAFITSLSLSLLMKTNMPVVAALSAALAIGSKYLIRYKGKHVFNPANFGIMVSMLLTGEVWLSTGQWGSGYYLILLVGVAGLVVLNRVGRIDTGLTFLLVYATLIFVKQVIYQGWELDVFFHSLSSGTLLLFSFFMITDPVSTPNAPKARVAWAAAIAILAFCLTNYFYVYAAPLWALFIMSPITAVLDRNIIAQPFKWKLS